MRRPLLVLQAMLPLLSLGCSSDPEVAGKAVIVLEDETLVFDTGNDGKESVSGAGGDWFATCEFKDERLGMVVYALPRSKQHFAGIGLFSHVDSPTHVNVRAEVDGANYNGVCPVTVRKMSEDPFEGDMSASGCELERAFDGAPAHLESASFHVEDCLDTNPNAN
jgi:hypothetical protein